MNAEEKKETTTSTKSSTRKKGTVVTEQVIGTAANNLKKGYDAIANAVKDISSLTEQAETMQGVIAQREDKIKELDVLFKETKRAKEVELELALREDEGKAVNGLLEKRGLMAISKDDFNSLTAETSKIKADSVAEANRATYAAASSMKKDHDNEMALAKANFDKESAQTMAELSNARSQITFLEAQVAMWKGALDAERTAGVERSKASSIGTMNISGPGSK